MKNNSTIKMLSLALRNQIAAGEVVERPSSVVKELVENSLDAKAKNIHINIENGGQSLIRIQDDGFGIAKEQLELAITRHATSKISNLDELMSIQSYGFRGEALSSIASVSKFSTTSFQHGQEGQLASAYKIDILHGHNMGITPASLHKGTIVEVRDLFENIPARLKFLKSPNTEQKRIQDSIIRIALSCPEISFKLNCGQRKTLDFTINQSLYERLCTIWPALITDHLKEFDSTYHGIRVHGLAATPQSKQNKSDRMYFYVNGRAINDKALIAGVKNAYKGHLTSREYPQIVLFLEIDPREVDVNVHPAKSEVRFRDNSAIFLAVSHALSPMLKDIDYPDYHAPNSKIESAQEIPLPQDHIGRKFSTIDNTKDNTIDKDIFIQNSKLWGNLDKPRIIPPRTNQINNEPTLYYNNGLAENIAEYNADYKPLEGNNIQNSSHAHTFEQTDDNGYAFSNMMHDNKFSALEHDSQNFSTVEHDSQNFSNIEYDSQNFSNIEHDNSSEHIAQNNAEQNFSQSYDEKLAQSNKEDFNYLGQIAYTYLLFSDKLGNLTILDQHAAHERILYAQIQQNAYTGMGQCLILPIELNLHTAEQMRFYALQEVLQKLGFQMQLENSSLKVHTIPPILERGKAIEFLREALVNKYDDLSPLFISMACKAAIKAGQKLSPDEAKGLIAIWQETKDNNFCPHGRPCILKWSVAHLEKLFKRRT